jgi:hypothetical protein
MLHFIIILSPMSTARKARQGNDFSLLHSIQTCSGAHLASYPMGTGGSFPTVKVAVMWSWPLTCT